MLLDACREPECSWPDHSVALFAGSWHWCQASVAMCFCKLLLHAVAQRVVVHLLLKEVNVASCAICTFTHGCLRNLLNIALLECKGYKKAIND